MTTAAEATRECIHVDVADASERDLHLSVAKVAEKDRHTRPSDRPRMLDDSVEVLGPHAMPLQGARAHRQPRHAAFLVDAKTTQNLGEETYAPRRGRCVDPLVHLFGIDAPRQ